MVLIYYGSKSNYCLFWGIVQSLSTLPSWTIEAFAITITIIIISSSIMESSQYLGIAAYV